MTILFGCTGDATVILAEDRLSREGQIFLVYVFNFTLSWPWKNWAEVIDSGHGLNHNEQLLW